jgi:RNA polymerase sigma factor (sigma-70 family)
VTVDQPGDAELAEPHADAARRFAALCHDVAPVLRRALMVQVRDRELAEDLAQEALLRVAERWDHVGAMDRPDLYAVRVATNLATSWWRRRAVHRRAAPRLAASARDDAVWLDPDGAWSVSVRAAVAALPARQREVVALRFAADLAVADVAAVMGCAEGTVKALTHQALARLRTALGSDDDPASDPAAAHTTPPPVHPAAPNPGGRDG